MDPRDAADMLALLPGAPVLFIAAYDIDWNARLSPWPAKRCFRGGEDFAGGAAELLKEVPASVARAEAESGASGLARAVMGYSLSGLFALYALMESDIFSMAASVSGSLWYEGFPAYLAAKGALPPGRRVYLSLGDLEEKARSPVLARVGEGTRRAADILRAGGAAVYFTYNPGNHFAHAAKRAADALGWLISQNQPDPS